MNAKQQKLLSRILKFLKRHNELLITVPLAVAVAILATRFMAGGDLMVYDYGVFQKPILALSFFLIAIAIDNIALYLRSTSLYNYSEPDSKENGKWKHLTERERVILAVIYRLVYFLGAIYLLGSI